MVRDLEETLAAREMQEPEQQQSSRRTGGKSIQLTWRESGKAPCEMCRGAATVEGNIACFKPDVSNEVYIYDSEKEEWFQLPNCPNSDFSLAVVKGLVTAIGGYDSAGEATSTLLSFTGQHESGTWVEFFPPMPTKRILTAAAHDGKILIVAGGAKDSGGAKDYEDDEVSGKLSTVEVMDTENLQWYTAASLPYPLDEATATICGDKVYLLGGLDQEYSATKSVLTCSLTALLQSCQPQSLQAQLQRTLALGDKDSVWYTIADIPVYLSTCTTLKGELVAVGGYASDYSKITAVYQYSPSTDSWQIINHLKTGRDKCLVAVLPNCKLMVVGGHTHEYVETDMIDFATVL